MIYASTHSSAFPKLDSMSSFHCGGNPFLNNRVNSFENPEKGYRVKSEREKFLH